MSDVISFGSDTATDPEPLQGPSESQVQIYRNREQIYRQIFTLQNMRQQQFLRDFLQTRIRPIEEENARRIQQRRRRAERVHAAATTQRNSRHPRMQPQLQDNVGFRLVDLGPPRKRLRKVAAEELQHVLKQAAELDPEECLVPIRLELEAAGYQLKDSFTWNLFETALPLPVFASVLCEDFKLPASIFVPLIVRQMTAQIQDFHHRTRPILPRLKQLDALVQVSEPQLAECSTVVDVPPCDEGHLREWDWREALRDLHQASLESPGELRCTICIHITIGNLQLVDQLEWDLLGHHSPSDPELAAEFLCADLGLGGEFVTATAHTIREQVYLYWKCLQMIGYPMDGSPVLHGEASEWFAQALDTVDRPESQRESYTPYLLQLTEQEYLQMERDRDREERRKRRGQQRNRKAAGSNVGLSSNAVDLFGFPSTASTFNQAHGEFTLSLQTTEVQEIALPDMKEPLRTIRTLPPLPANVPLPLLQGAELANWTLKYASTQVPAQLGVGGSGTLDAFSDGATPRRTGRAAAQQASANISALAQAELYNGAMMPSQTQPMSPFIPKNTHSFSAFPERPTAAPISTPAFVTAPTEPIRDLAPPPYSYADHGVEVGWRCASCHCRPTYTSAILDGPSGPKTLCCWCGTFWQRDKTLPHGRDASAPDPKRDLRPLNQKTLSECLSNDGIVYPLADRLLPQALAEQRQHLHEKYPSDFFDLVQITKGPLRLLNVDRSSVNVRIHCFECDPEGKGKVYALGPSLTMGNFENHLRKKGHRTCVEKRLARGDQV